MNPTLVTAEDFCPVSNILSVVLSTGGIVEMRGDVGVTIKPRTVVRRD